MQGFSTEMCVSGGAREVSLRLVTRERQPFGSHICNVMGK
jgi:hypothetical protein